MDKICMYLIFHYKDNEITDKKSLIAFKQPGQNTMTNPQLFDHIKENLANYIETDLKDVKVNETSDEKSVSFKYKGNDCEISVINVDNEHNVHYWVLTYY